MSKNDSVKDRRKYQRVLVEPSSRHLSVDVKGHGRTLVFDMSYEGAAFAQPKEKKITKVDSIIALGLKTEADEAELPARVVRVNDEVVAVQFDSIDVAARIIIDRVVTDRIVGLNMQFIDPRHYHKNTDFTHWFHGPKETNLYLWWKGEQLTKARMDLASSMMMFEDEMLFFENKLVSQAVPQLNNQQIGLKVRAIVQQMEMDIEPLHSFKKLIEDHVGS